MPRRGRGRTRAILRPIELTLARIIGRGMTSPGARLAEAFREGA